MKSTTVALGFLAGMATASYNHPRHFHAPRPYYRRDNGTEPTQTTLTVKVTQVHTITSCAPTVTNCPARNGTAISANDAYATIPASDLITSEVTQVVELTTTVCPVAEASSIASSVSAAHSSGLITGTTKDVTATATSDNSGATGSVVTSASVGTTDVPLTYTVGPETAKSVITTTVKSTYTAQVTVTLTKSASTGASSNSPQGTTTDSEGTTTTTSTSTGTRTVTISKASTATASGYPVATGSAGVEEVTGNSAATGSVSEGSCAEATTVTVTAPASTIYVTVGASSAAPSAASATASSPAAATTGSSSTGSDNSATGSDAGDDESSDDSSDADECDADEATSTDAGVVYATATATVVPYPVGGVNGTYPVPTGAYRHKN
ncbi:hypothetical protein BKA67DRAFT_90176 [Truncatella angustata]|uniref:Uncharacterized protein n=1 Tax=Truncatella angustata TaxID=152316 RepID=A0A9P8RHH5_9PEZI|nr:uncharacterized protein BKA67DRAFT_90176 [Truncatella angustata]KAH6645942.1 hypothetical protein BKA67DRAFT_90176 [Truncatella angustata]KAH8205324.1 hypothetical protein TruAng_000571 [Truncatella angustata]